MFERLKKNLKEVKEKLKKIVAEKREEVAEARQTERSEASGGEAMSAHASDASNTEVRAATEQQVAFVPETHDVEIGKHKTAAVAENETAAVAENETAAVAEEAAKREEERARKIGARLKAIFRREIFLDEQKLNGILEEFEEDLLESDVALPVAEEIISNVREHLTGEKRRAGEDVSEIISNALRDALLSVFPDSFDIVDFICMRDKPAKIVFVGVNGTGKTTTIAKFAHFLMKRGFSVVLASADTYRTGAVEQLEKHAAALGGLKVIKHRYGADPAAVVYDAIRYAEAHRKDVVLADTAGRMHTNVNLMEQLRKICRVTKPDLVIFVDEAIAGNDAVERARRFNEYVGIDASILTKTDMDVKGGAAVSIAHITSKPILFLGTGQKYEDLMPFDPEDFVNNLLS